MKTDITSGSSPETVAGNIDDHAAATAESQFTISIFLSLLILSVFVLPSIGLGDTNERWYGSIVFSILIGAGIAIAWRRRRLFFFSALIGVTAVSIRWFTLWIQAVPGYCAAKRLPLQPF
jgi:hypothetical protein